MSLAAVTEALENFAVNDTVLLDTLLGDCDREFAEIEAERATMNAFLDARRDKVAQRKVAIVAEFDARADDLHAIRNGKA